MDTIVRCFVFALSLGLLGTAAGWARAAGLSQDARPTTDRAPLVLKTWHPWQLDSVLAAWVIRQSRGVAAVDFESVERGIPLPPDIAIDTPDSPYRRSGQRTAFDEAVRLEGLEAHACVPSLREAVRIVELAPWRKPERPLVEAFEARVLTALPATPRRGGLEAAFAQVTSYCEGGPGRKRDAAPSAKKESKR